MAANEGSTMTTQAAPKTLGDLEVTELLRSARREVLAFDESLERELDLTPDQKLVFGAYTGSVAARITVALAKIEEEA
jgi:hypothetical protein